MRGRRKDSGINVSLLISVCIVFFCLLRIWLAYNTPAMVIENSLYDDNYYINQAQYLLDGQWLGSYSSLTLIKGITFSLFLIIPYVLRIPYFVALCLLNMAACGVLCRSLEGLIKNRYVRLVLFFVLVYSPITFDYDVVQRLYRNALAVPLALLVFAGIFGMYFNIARKRTFLKYSAAEGGSLFLFYNLREDFYWVLPFVLVATAVIFIKVILHIRNKRTGRQALLLLYTCVPLLVLFLGNSLISTVNYRHYGIYNVNDRTSGAFSDVAEMFIRVDYQDGDDVDPGAVFMSRDKFAYIIDHSASLTKYKDAYLSAYDSWAQNVFHGKNVQGDHLQWMFRAGLESVGFYQNGAETEAYLRQVRKELDDAVDADRIQLKKEIFLSSSTKTMTIGDLLSAAAETMFRAMPAMAGYDGVDARAKISEGSDQYIRKVEFLTNTNVLYETDEDQVPMEYAADIVEAENAVIAVYKAPAFPVYLFCILAWIGLTVLQFTKIRKARPVLFDYWIVSSSLILSAFVLLYMTTVFSCWMESVAGAFYTSPAYILVLLFEYVLLFCAVSCAAEVISAGRLNSGETEEVKHVKISETDAREDRNQTDE